MLRFLHYFRLPLGARHILVEIVARLPPGPRGCSSSPAPSPPGVRRPRYLSQAGYAATYRRLLAPEALNEMPPEEAGALLGEMDFQAVVPIFEQAGLEHGPALVEAMHPNKSVPVLTAIAA